MRRLSADTARCPGRTHNHPYYAQECCECMRKLSPPHERQVYMAPWQEAHGTCPDLIKQEEE